MKEANEALLLGLGDPERLPYWVGGDHEIDFVDCTHLLEVKRGRRPLEFATGIDWLEFLRGGGPLQVVRK